MQGYAVVRPIAHHHVVEAGGQRHHGTGLVVGKSTRVSLPSSTLIFSNLASVLVSWNTPFRNV